KPPHLSPQRAGMQGILQKVRDSGGLSPLASSRHDTPTDRTAEQEIPSPLARHGFHPIAGPKHGDAGDDCGLSTLDRVPAPKPYVAPLPRDAVISLSPQSDSQDSDRTEPRLRMP